MNPDRVLSVTGCILDPMRKLALVGAVLLLTLTGCGTPAPKTDTADFLILARVAFDQPAGSTVANDEMIAAGHAVCTSFSHGDDWPLVLAGATSSGRLTEAQGKLFIEASVKVFCPEYVNKLP